VTIYLSFAGAIVLAILPKGKPALLVGWRSVARGGLAFAIAGFIAGVGQGRTVLSICRMPSMGIHFLAAADGISRVLVLLTGLAAVQEFFSWNIELRTNEFFLSSCAHRRVTDFLSFDLLYSSSSTKSPCAKYFLIRHLGSTRASTRP